MTRWRAVGDMVTGQVRVTARSISQRDGLLRAVLRKEGDDGGRACAVSNHPRAHARGLFDQLAVGATRVRVDKSDGCGRSSGLRFDHLMNIAHAVRRRHAGADQCGDRQRAHGHGKYGGHAG